MSFAAFSVGFLALIATCLAVAAARDCSRSEDCYSGQCCRDRESNITLTYDPESYLHGLLSSGTCVPGGARPGEVCDSGCSCPEGYECYRKTTGACCAPFKCITTEEADRDRLISPCFLPPMAPSGGDLNPKFRRRQAFPTTEICDHLFRQGLLG